MDIHAKIERAQKHLDTLLKQRERNYRAVHKRWNGKFVRSWTEGHYYHQEVTELGEKELSKYGLVYIKKEGAQREFIKSKKGCFICGDVHCSSHVQKMSFFGNRFSTCPKHNDFLLMGENIKSE